jgi:hypothetical protein
MRQDFAGNEPLDVVYQCWASSPSARRRLDGALTRLPRGGSGARLRHHTTNRGPLCPLGLMIGAAAVSATQMRRRKNDL